MVCLLSLDSTLNYRRHCSPGHRVAQAPPPRQGEDTFGGGGVISRIVSEIHLDIQELLDNPAIKIRQPLDKLRELQQNAAALTKASYVMYP
jgi:hypothetical protein